MYKNRIKEAWAAGRPALGISFQSESPITAEVVARSGIDYAMIDMEHGPFGPLSYEKLWVVCRIFHVNNVTPIAKVPDGNATHIGKALDAGVMGIVLPHCSTANDARALVSACLFPPHGDRGFSPVVPANHFVGNSMSAYVSLSNAEVLPIPLIEDRSGIDNIEAIIDVEGIGAIRAAKNDLALSYGVAPKDPSLSRILQKVIDLCAKKGVPVEVNERAPEELLEFSRRGVRVMSTFGVDHVLLHDACRTRVERVREVFKANS